jgi:hypothetical protein
MRDSASPLRLGSHPPGGWRNASALPSSPGNSYVHSNTVEGFFSIFQRGMKGMYQHCNHAHLQR